MSRTPPAALLPRGRNDKAEPTKSPYSFHQRGQGNLDHRRPTQGVRQFPRRQQLRETLDNPGLPHARLAHQNQIVLPALQQDLSDFQHLRPPTDQRRQSPLCRQLRQIPAKSPQGGILLFLLFLFCVLCLGVFCLSINRALNPRNTSSGSCPSFVTAEEITGSHCSTKATTKCAGRKRPSSTDAKEAPCLKTSRKAGLRCKGRSNFPERFPSSARIARRRPCHHTLLLKFATTLFSQETVKCSVVRGFKFKLNLAVTGNRRFGRSHGEW